MELLMKAAVWHGRQDVRIERVEDPPDPPAGQLQVEVAWCGICGTDLHEYMGGPVYIPQDSPHPLTSVRAPVLIGHEMSGTVIAVGRDVQDFSVGDRVVACPIIGCQRCRWCRSGSMAQCDQVAFGHELVGRSTLGTIEPVRVPVLSLARRHLRRSGCPGRTVFSDSARGHDGTNRTGGQRCDCWRWTDRIDGIDGREFARSKTSGGRGS